jgi:lysophospholipase L1-like esterase
MPFKNLVIIKLLFISLFVINEQKTYGNEYSHFNTTMYNRIDTTPLQLNNLPIFNEAALTGLFQKLYLLKKGKGENVTVLHLGDSHVQIGNFPAAIRDVFTNVWGGTGFGTIFPYQLAGFNNFYVQSKVTSGEWDAKRYRFEDDQYEFGVMGYTAKTFSSQASLEINVRGNKPEITSFNKVQLLYGDPNNSYTIRLKGSSEQEIEFISADECNDDITNNNQANWKKQTYCFKELKNKLQLTVVKKNGAASDFNLYGIVLEDTSQKGVVYDICGVDGARFSHLCTNADLSIEQIATLNPDLIIFSFGSNESYTKTFDSLAYQDMIIKYLHSIKTIIPEVAILLTSPPDTKYKDMYPINTSALQNILKNAAISKDLAFFDLREQMGGAGSISDWLSTKLAGPDKLHFTKEGYTLQAHLIMQAFLQSYNKTVAGEDKVPDIDLSKYNFLNSLEIRKSSTKFSDK